MNRRVFLGTTLVGLTGLATSCRAPRPLAAGTNPLAVPFDREMTKFMAARGIPGGALAVIRDRRLLYAQGYGWADREARRPARPESLFRIASVSKPITALAVLKLAQEGRLDLEARAFGLLALPPGPVPGKGPGVTPLASPDPRLQQITVRQLLQHTGGWDRE